MPITLRNKAVEEKIRAIGRRTGEGPSAVIARLVAAEQPDTGLVSDAEAEARRAWWDAFRADRPSWKAEDLAEAEAFAQGMYDRDGLPR